MVVTPGGSYVNALARVPTFVLTLATTATNAPLPYPEAQVRLVPVDHDVVAHSALPRVADAVKSEVPKLIPEMVTPANPLVGALVMLEMVTTGGS